jgi:hypothetical protein
MADADKIFLTKLLREMRPGVLPMTPKQSDRVLNGLVGHPSAEETKISKVLLVHKEFLPERKTMNAEFNKGVMDRLLKRIQRFRPAAFCSRYFVLLHDNAPAHKAASFCQFFTKKKKCYKGYHPPGTLQIYLRQNIFCFSSRK